MAAAKMNDKSEDAVKSISALKYQVGNAAKLIGEEAIQLHGGMGVTEETVSYTHLTLPTMFEV